MNIDPNGNGAWIAAGDGNNRAQVHLPVRREYVDRPVPVSVPIDRPLHRRKSPWCIFILVLIILVVIGVVVAVAVVYTVRKKSQDTGYY